MQSRPTSPPRRRDRRGARAARVPAQPADRAAGQGRRARGDRRRRRRARAQLRPLVAEKGAPASSGDQRGARGARRAGQNRLAVELDLAQARRRGASIVKTIEKASGRTIEATRTVDPSLIGGIVLQIGSHRADGSVRGRLERLRHELATARKEKDLEATPGRDHRDPQGSNPQFDVETDLSEVGTVLQVGDGIARIHGLENCVALERLELEHGVTGVAFNLEDNVGVALRRVAAREGGRAGAAHRRGHERSRRPGAARPRRRPARQPARRARPDRGDERRPLEFKAPGVIQRQPVKEPLQTGLKAIDSMTAIGRGQRELIIGDRSTGKTAVAIDTILNQRGGDVICIYVAVGPEGLDGGPGRRAAARLGRMEYTIVVSAPAQEAAPIKWMAPFAGCAMGEYFLYNGKHALCIYDDLSKHADAYRQLSLLLRRPPAARRSRATSSTSTRGCSSARASSQTTSAVARSPRSRSSRRRPATSPRTSRRTSSRSPTGRSSSSRASSSRACGRRSTSARRSRAWAATPRRRR